MNINLHIEQLVLDGVLVARGQSAQVRQAVEQELTRLLATGELQKRAWTSGIDLHRLQTREIQVAQEPRPARLGEQIAGAVYGGLFE